jgi:5-methylcytosine-specific restriction endonuclease McrBC GTP-binding regulatory subunit McrB
MSSNIVTSRGQIIKGKDLRLSSQKQYKGYLERALSVYGWTCSQIDYGNGGYLVYELNHEDGSEQTIHVYLKPVVWRNRHPDEKAAQMSANLDMRGFEAGKRGEPLYVFGIYRDPTSSKDENSQDDEFVICSWLPTEWGNNRGNSAYNYFIRTDIISRAFKFGFSSAIVTERTVYAFRPESLYYYMDNQDQLHQKEVTRSIENDFHKLTGSVPLNQILYGPPGTGKTYTTVEKAVQIIEGIDTSELEWAIVKRKYDSHVESGNIRFVTFHQSYSYEEFVEGIKPIVNDEGNIQYEVVDGVFKKLCIDAMNPSIIEVGDMFQNTKGSNLVVVDANQSVVQVSREDDSIITFPTNLILNLLDLVKNETLTPQSISDRSHGGKHIKEYFSTTYDSYIFGYDSVLRPMIEFLITKSETYKRKGNYVLIIDEINRGNISRIFGELITLLEETKRLGKPEEIKLKLTYSGQKQGSEDFGVPSNVYIVGTMNSADRSIALIDTALRRRFTFYNFPSNNELVPEYIDDVNLRQLFKIINQRIEFLLNVDHLLGHGYFMNVKNKTDLGLVFRNKIIPLLEEYFYGDFEKIQMILGDNPEYRKDPNYKLIISNQQSTQKTIFGTDIDGFEDKKLYSLRQDLLDEDYENVPIQVYKSIYGDFGDVQVE